MRRIAFLDRLPDFAQFLVGRFGGICPAKGATMLKLRNSAHPVEYSVPRNVVCQPAYNAISSRTAVYVRYLTARSRSKDYNGRLARRYGRLSWMVTARSLPRRSGGTGALVGRDSNAIVTRRDARKWPASVTVRSTRRCCWKRLHSGGGSLTSRIESGHEEFARAPQSPRGIGIA
jgi:hypothetical protein